MNQTGINLMGETVQEVLTRLALSSPRHKHLGAALTQIAKQREIKFLRNEDSGFGIVKKTHYADSGGVRGSENRKR